MVDAAPRPDAPADAPVAAAAEPARPPRWAPFAPALDVALRVAGLLVAVLIAGASALLEVFLSPLRLGGQFIWVSAAAALVINYWLVWFTAGVTGKRWLGWLPALVWIGIVVWAANRSAEGDLLLTSGNTVAVVMMFGGSLAFAVAAYRLILSSTPPRRPPPGAGGPPPQTAV